MKVLKHFIYLQYGCGMQLTGLPSLNHDTTTSFGSTLPKFYKNKFLHPHLHRYNSLRFHPYAHPHTSTLNPQGHLITMHHRLTGVHGKLLAPPSPCAQHQKSGAPCTRDSHGKLPPVARNQKRNTLKSRVLCPCVGYCLQDANPFCTVRGGCPEKLFSVDCIP